MDVFQGFFLWRLSFRCWLLKGNALYATDRILSHSHLLIHSFTYSLPTVSCIYYNIQILKVFLPQETLGDGRNIAWMGHQCIAGNYAYTHSHSDSHFIIAHLPISMCLGRVRELVNPAGTHVNIGRTHRNLRSG